MTIGLLGRKVGMTRVFTDEGASIPVTVLSVPPNYVSQLKSTEQDGYDAVQLSLGDRKISRVNKSEVGHFAKASVPAGDYVEEFRVDSLEPYQAGQSISVADIFKVGQVVDVSAKTKGKGFSGVVKRHNFATQDATHGNSLSHRAPGSIGQNQSPGKVFKGKKMAGQYGNKKCTVQNLEIVKVDEERSLLLIKGGVPGAPGAKVRLKHAVKKDQQGGTDGS